MIRRGFLAVALLLCGPRLGAHKLQYSLTDLRWRVDRKVLEIQHSFHLDDAMVLLARLGDPGGGLDAASQAQVMRYVEQRFGLDLHERALALEPVGAQIDGDYLWVYQELALSTYPDSLGVRCSLLHDLFPAQQNQVNLQFGDSVRTLRFDLDHQIGVFSPASTKASN